jgi:2-amino-4-hydroxy-6-hydroxymethyldihydropteridine diphosphokinase
MRAAVQHMRAIMDVHEVSHLYAAQPLGVVRNDTLLSAVAHCMTDLIPIDLLIELQKIERKLGSSRVQGPRPIDLDILFYDSVIIDTYRLLIPHPRLAERAYVLMPLAEIAPNLMHPVLYYTPVQLLQDAEDAAQVRVYTPMAPEQMRERAAGE